MKHPDIGYIAELQDESRLIKVGRTRGIRQRIATIRQTSPFDVKLVAIFAGGTEGERELKRAMVEHCQKGEWFRPNDILDTTLRKWRKEGRLLKQVSVDDAYVERVILPALRGYLNGREPNNNYAGDLAYRLLHGGLPDVLSRINDLAEGTEGAITAEMTHGYVSCGDDDTSVSLLSDFPRRRNAAA